jgi:hypothetical protein
LRRKMGAKSALLRASPGGGNGPTDPGAKSAPHLYLGAPAPETGGGRGVGVHLKCLHCDRSFEHQPKRSGRYPRTCSFECRDARKRAQDQRYRREGRYRQRKRGRRTIYAGICVVCEASFTAKNKPTRTCSQKCGAILNGRTRTDRAKARNRRQCPICRRSFWSRNPSAKQRRNGYIQKHCSYECAKVACRTAIAKRANQDDGTEAHIQ